MKRCPQCGRTYTDANLAFCLADGKPLELIAPPPAPAPVPVQPTLATYPPQAIYPPPIAYPPAPADVPLSQVHLPSLAHLPGGGQTSPTGAKRSRTPWGWIVAGAVVLFVWYQGHSFIPAGTTPPPQTPGAAQPGVLPRGVIPPENKQPESTPAAPPITTRDFRTRRPEYAPGNTPAAPPITARAKVDLRPAVQAAVTRISDVLMRAQETKNPSLLTGYIEGAALSDYLRRIEQLRATRGTLRMTRESLNFGDVLISGDGRHAVVHCTPTFRGTFSMVVGHRRLSRPIPQQSFPQTVSMEKRNGRWIAYGFVFDNKPNNL